MRYPGVCAFGKCAMQYSSPLLATRKSRFGSVNSVAIITDRDTGRSKGFGFVEFPNDDEARNAISALSGQEYGGRALTVNEARPKTQGSGGPRRY